MYGQGRIFPQAMYYVPTCAPKERRVNIVKLNGVHIVYKVVYNDGGRLYSALHPKARENCAGILRYRILEYVPGEMTWPKLGKIFAFSTWKDAKAFREGLLMSSTNTENLEIWKCVSSKAVKAPFRFMPDLRMTLKDLRRWWEGKFEMKDDYGERSRSQRTPDCTVVCDDLTLWRKK